MRSGAESGLARRGWLLTLVVLGVVGVVVFTLLNAGRDGGQPVSAATESPSAAPTTTPSSIPTPTPSAPSTPVEIVRPPCVGPNDLTNVEGLDLDTLPADCGTEPVPAGSHKPLGLACGGAYPAIMYKTTTSHSKTTICGKDASGEFNYLVTRPNGGATVEMVAEYVPGLDAFVGKRFGVTYTVEAYNGSLTIKKDGISTREPSKEWISLDNEPDSD